MPQFFLALLIWVSFTGVGVTPLMESTGRQIKTAPHVTVIVSQGLKVSPIWRSLGGKLLVELREAGVGVRSGIATRPGEYEITLRVVVEKDYTTLSWQIWYCNRAGYRIPLYISDADWLEYDKDDVYGHLLQYIEMATPRLVRALEAHEQDVVQNIRKRLGYQQDL